MKLTREDFLKYTEECPIIAAVKDFNELVKCKKSECKFVYILFGDICNISGIVEEVKKMNKFAIVHIDLVTGFGIKEICVDFIKNHTKADGIISTKPILIKRAKELDLFTVQRFFMIDFITYANVKKQVKVYNPDVIELLPAGLSKVIKFLCEDIDIPVVASGLVLDKDDVIGALSAGAIAVSTTNNDVWFY